MSENRELLPELLTKRLILRQYTELDLDALFVLLSDREVNTFLPWFPVKTREEALQFLREHFLIPGQSDFAYCYAVCLQTDQIPIGYITVRGPDSYDFGYALRKEFWNQGIMTEGARAVVNELKRAGVPYVTATHDVNNPASGAVMRKLGMSYRYSYEELVQPKNISVIFRMYQLTLNAPDDQTYYEYWNLHPHHFIEPIK